MTSALSGVTLYVANNAIVNCDRISDMVLHKTSIDTASRYFIGTNKRDKSKSYSCADKSDQHSAVRELQQLMIHYHMGMQHEDKLI